jgi:prepilin-type processing-associated H-X9-DG protein/prepilin-type N-terminal cleavage/methylation domain-containing protein
MKPPQQSIKCQSDSAVTLLELLVAVAIVVLLSSLIYPSVKVFFGRSLSAKCTANLRQIYVASRSWSSDNNMRIVPVFDPGDAGAKSLWNWTGHLAPYMGREGTNDFESAAEVPAFVCPVNPNRFGYGYNYLYLSWIQTAPGNTTRWVSTTSVARPSQTVFLVDSANINTKTEGFSTWRAFVRPPSLAGAKDILPAYRHPGKTTNVLWLDGHVSAEQAKTAFDKDDQLWDIQ